MKINNESSAPPELDSDATVFITALGYESRSRWSAENLRFNARKKIAIRFGYSETAAFPINYETFVSLGFDIVDSSKQRYEQQLIETVLASIGSHDENVRIILDFSVMSRLMLADVVTVLGDLASIRPINVYSMYMPSAYLPPGEPMQLNKAEPVRAEFSGWSAHPDIPLAAFVGLGYEEGLALGAIEFLDPSYIWCFEPKGDDLRYAEKLADANRSVKRSFDATFLEYDLRDPIGLRSRIDELLRNLRGRARVAIIPFGPKLFAWISMLIAMQDSTGDLSVWRFSTHDQNQAVDRQPAGSPIWYSFLASK
ncbi:MAG TPA: hypothetical protein VGI20_13050 [Rhizomicrobium sp.]